jgi:hypothetical protein
MNEFKVIIAGGRDFSDYSLLRLAMEHFLEEKEKTHKIVVVCGKAPGADTLGEKFAKEKGYKVVPFPADWDRHGKSAGFKRNTAMGTYADVLVVFWDGKSKGTKHMIDIMSKLRKRMRIVRY